MNESQRLRVREALTKAIESSIAEGRTIQEVASDAWAAVERVITDAEYEDLD